MGRYVDPLLLFILELVIIAAMLYLYLWLRAISRRVEDRELDAKLDDLEDSVSETTHWLERASAEIRDDIEQRTDTLQKLLADAEHLVEDIRRTGASQAPAAEAPRASSVTAPTPSGPVAPTAAGTPVGDFADASARSGDEREAIAPAAPPPVPAAVQSEKEADASELSDTNKPVDWHPPEVEDEVGALIDAAVAEAERAVAVEDDPAPAPDEPAPDGGQPPSSADRRQQILELVERNLDPGQIAEQLGASRAEVELVAAMRRRRT